MRASFSIALSNLQKKKKKCPLSSLCIWFTSFLYSGFQCYLQKTEMPKLGLPNCSHLCVVVVWGSTRFTLCLVLTSQMVTGLCPTPRRLCLLFLLSFCFSQSPFHICSDPLWAHIKSEFPKYRLWGDPDAIRAHEHPSCVPPSGTEQALTGIGGTV